MFRCPWGKNNAKFLAWLLKGTLMLVILGAVFAIGKSLIPPKLPLNSRQWIEARIKPIQPGPYHIGDRIPVTLQIESRDGLTYAMPALRKVSSENWEITGTPRINHVRYRGGNQRSRRYEVTFWQTGRFSIGALPFQYRVKNGKHMQYRIPSLSIKVASVLPKGKTKAQLLALKLKNTKSAVGLPPDYPKLWYILAAACLIALTALLVLWIRKSRQLRKEVKTDVPAEDIPAHVVAFRRLAALKERNYVQQGDFKTYYTELSECLREYLENRFQIRALEMTTEEFLTFLSENQTFAAHYRKLLNDFLHVSDLIKFAQHVPDLDEAERAWEQVYHLVEVTREQDNSTATPEKASDGTPAGTESVPSRKASGI